MKSKVLTLSFHGVRVALHSRQEEILSELGRDFAYFLKTEPQEEPHIRLELAASKPPSGRLIGWTPLHWRSARIRDGAVLRKVDYAGRALLEYDLRRESGILYCDESPLLHELAYLAVLSRVGEKLDRERLHRVHALGFSYKGSGGLLLLPSGGGKSRLGLELLNRPDFSLLADDIPLLASAGRRLEAFPLRLGLRGEDWRGIPERHLRVFRRRRFEDKRLVDLEYFREKVAASAPLTWILLGRPMSGSGGRDPGPLLEPCSRPRAAAALLGPLILGIGTPQILELMLPRPPWIFGGLRLARCAFSRARAALAAAANARCARFRLGPDPEANVCALRDFLDLEA